MTQPIEVVLPGFEPRQAEPKTAVLPLHHKTILVLKPKPKACAKVRIFFLTCKNDGEKNKTVILKNRSFCVCLHTEVTKRV